ncbi:glutamate--tRNA ligase [Minwuia thermotolerans]|uniref:Glutamate--tRNA ligase n=1 Tax=Minwuia thermotolerans TaxID=2056226 RepID=A0A2M9G1H2_9PROT|nr:glutamate--tRNA ligase [Minwuia thermotolerans]PJK29561.1 glutamate--tRNA ligase [Minwuia thermotolerans]
MPKDGVVTRFAPSPTGFLHIGGARTALFNWLYARHHGGRFLLRIEDTDRKRSTDTAIEAIFDGLNWLGLEADEEPVFQFARQQRHAEIVEQLLDRGEAYRCYASPEELQAMRDTQRAAGQPVRYDGRWRDRDPADAPKDVLPAIRLKAPRTGETIIEDLVQGQVSFQNEQLDDMVLLRADGTPTYMLSVVVDDHDMDITHIIRGDDHLVNAARQSLIFRALGWRPPKFAHIPLIHGPDGAKLSKRHGALGVDAYRDMGFLPEAMRNYLVRLGWAHGDDEIFSTEQAIEWFDLDHVGRSAARFDFQKLEHLNGHYLRQADDGRLVGLVCEMLARKGQDVDADGRARLLAIMPSLKERARTVAELAESAGFLFAERPIATNEKAARLLSGEAPEILAGVRDSLAALEDWNAAAAEAAVRDYAETNELKLGKVAQPLRAALTGSNVSPGIFDVLVALGREESLARIGDRI